MNTKAIEARLRALGIILNARTWPSLGTEPKKRKVRWDKGVSR